MSEHDVSNSALWNEAPVMQDAPLTIFGGLRAFDALMAVGAFFFSNYGMQTFTELRYLIILLLAITFSVSSYLAMLAIRKSGPEGFHWSFLHWLGLFPIVGALPHKGIRNEPF